MNILLQTTQPVVQGMPVDQLIMRIGLYSAVGIASVIGFFKVLDLIIERMGGTRRLWKEQMQKQIQTLAQATSTLTDVNKINSNTENVSPEIEKMVSEIASGGTGDGTIKTEKV